MDRTSHGISPGDLGTVLETMREGLQIVDRSWRYVYLNDAAVLHSRRPREELLNRTMAECYPGIEQSGMFAQLQRCMADGTPSELTNDFVYPDGSKRIFDLRISPCELGVMVLSIDVSDSRNLEAQFRQAQKMDAMGRLASGVAHDFNNLLSVILGYGALLLGDERLPEVFRGDLEVMKQASERAATLTRQLLAFSRQSAAAPRALDLLEVMKESEKMLRRLVGENIEFVVRGDRPLDRVLCDSGQIDQVVMNLAVNARDAMPKGGKLTIEARNVTLDEAYAQQHLGVTAGPHVMLAVSDTGVGMDKETQARIFEPFFTTKEKGKGTGLGLSTVFGIVQQSRGSVWVESEPGKGTTFKVYFPRTETVDAPAPEVARPVHTGGTETILLVEDQDDVRRVANEILRRGGYRILEARGPMEALALSERHPRAIHLLLTDVVMPQMSGPQLATRLKLQRPDMRILFMSGYTEASLDYRELTEAGAAYLQKPLTPDALSLRIREVLDAPRSDHTRAL